MPKAILPKGHHGSFTRKQREEMAGRPRPSECEVCGSTDRISWDHDHGDRRFRGWICSPCNTALGFVRDCPDRLRKLAKYIEDYRAKRTPLAQPGPAGLFDS